MLERVPNTTSLQDVISQKLGRSFHLGNITTRDLIGLFFGVEGEVFDLNRLNDTAYFPKQIAFQKRVHDLLLAKETEYAATSILAKPPIVGTGKIQHIVDEAFENSSTLGGFWMRLTQAIPGTESTTFSEKISEHSTLATKVLETVTQHASDEMLAHLRSRYITPTGTLLPYAEHQGDIFIYRDEHEEVRVHKNDLTQQSLHFLKNWSELTKKNVAVSDVSAECYGPVFCNEMNTLILYCIESIRNNQPLTYHIAGQAMYGYIKKDAFVQNFEDMLDILLEQKVVTKANRNGLELFPAHFFRFIGTDQELIHNWREILTTQDTITQLNKEKGELFKQKYNHTSPEVVALMEQIKNLNTYEKQLLHDINHNPEILDLPADTFREGKLNTLYQSQLDLIHTLEQGFDPKSQRTWATELPISQLEKINAAIVSAKKK